MSRVEETPAGPIIHLDLETEPVDHKGWPGQCDKSPDTCHHMVCVAYGLQSSQTFKCKFCGHTVTD